MNVQLEYPDGLAGQEDGDSYAENEERPGEG
jgi:hypothetical protein